MCRGHYENMRPSRRNAAALQTSRWLSFFTCHLLVCASGSQPAQGVPHPPGVVGALGRRGLPVCLNGTWTEEDVDKSEYMEHVSMQCDRTPPCMHFTYFAPDEDFQPEAPAHLLLYIKISNPIFF